MFKTIVRKFSNVAPTHQYLLYRLKAGKRQKGLSYLDIANDLKKSEIYVASVFNGQHPLKEEDFESIYNLFLDKVDKESSKSLLTKIPVRGQNAKIYSRDPTVYRLQEIVSVYGPSIKELVEEKAGNGIMSAIDCKINVNVKEDGNKGKRIVLEIDGKFLEYNC